ncbi:MAG: hypothetical protein K2W82_15570 [Candidatus Obscuribacterales bacterium]|nr:hypothetical protein [Candidatus Obscuribacterales bacterium]
MDALTMMLVTGELGGGGGGGGGNDNEDDRLLIVCCIPFALIVLVLGVCGFSALWRWGEPRTLIASRQVNVEIVESKADGELTDVVMRDLDSGETYELEGGCRWLKTVRPGQKRQLVRETWEQKDRLYAGRYVHKYRWPDFDPDSYPSSGGWEVLKQE